jgi:hypothetical protein
MKNLFNSVKLQRPKENTFDLTHDVKMSGKMGNLMPCCLMEAVPGDKFTLGSDLFIRFAPLIAPVMHRMDATVHYFFVPNRILWDNWQDFITNNAVVGTPYLTMGAGLTADQKRLADYLGVPPCPPSGTSELVSALPFAAYQCVYNEYYRDQNLVPEVNFKLVDNSNDANIAELMTLRKRAWEHDYFTASLPFAQKGAAVDIPLGQVELNPTWTGTPGFISDNPIADTPIFGQIENDPVDGIKATGGTAIQGAYDPADSLSVGATTINDLRRAFKLQEWLERNARGGTRYIENILAHFGVKSSDARLQRPEYITGAKSAVIVSEVLNMTGQTGGLPQGNMAGHAVSVETGYKGTYYAEEHGYIIGILSIMPKTAYQQGIPRTYLKTQNTDYYWPSFAHIGEQEVQLKELYAYDGNGEDTFGYVPRYAEYKYMPSRVAGDFRTTLDFWHLGRIFATAPALNDEFIECTPEDVDRIFAVTSIEDNLYCQVLNKVKARRSMPVFGTPMI